MSTFKLRRAVIEDVPNIKDCVTAAYHHYIERMGKPPGPMVDDYAVVIQEHSATVAYRLADGVLVGLLVLIKQENDLLLDNVAVHPDFQGQKLGKLLMQKAEAVAVELGYSSIILYTHEMMTENQAIYEKIGYAETHRIHEKGFDRIYMRKSLLGMGMYSPDLS